MLFATCRPLDRALVSALGQPTDMDRLLRNHAVAQDAIDDMLACVGGAPVARVLLYHGADANAFFGNALGAAAAKGDLPTMRVLMDNGADPNAFEQAARRDPERFVGCDDEELPLVPLAEAAANGHAEAVRLLVRHGANANAFAGFDWPFAPLAFERLKPLWAAIHGGNVDVVELLLDAGAVPDGDDGAPLRVAAACRNTAAAHLLIERGVDVDAGDGDAWPLSIAARNGDVGLLRALLGVGADPDVGDGEPLRCAIARGYAVAVSALVLGGATVTARHVDMARFVREDARAAVLAALAASPCA